MISYETLGVPRVINASGRMTALGGAALHAEVIAAMVEGARANVNMDALKDIAGEKLAAWCGVESAMVTPGASAGNVIMTAAAISGNDPYRAAQLPHPSWPRREIVLQLGHAVSYGGRITQDIAHGGGIPILAGTANDVHTFDIAGVINERTAAVFFVQSHHAVQKGMLSLPAVIAIAHEKGVPVLLDAAAEENVHKYTAMGTDLVTYSGGKAFEGPTSGFILGDTERIAACRLQEGGIARPMKVGKETILGLLAAMERYVTNDVTAEKARQMVVIETLQVGLADLPHTRLSIEQDEAGRAIWRLHLALNERALGFTATTLMEDLRTHDPSVIPRGHWANTGVIALDPRPIGNDDVPVIIEAVQTAYAHHDASRKGDR